MNRDTRQFEKQEINSPGTCHTRDQAWHPWRSRFYRNVMDIGNDKLQLTKNLQ
ncbi:MAG: hypothetical protein MJA30_16580 [Cytophagales bacterium]|nr:hypothetical protein [Cytophagales bacterium]